MKNLRKIAAVLLCVLMVMSIAGCSAMPKSQAPQWGYKTEAKEYSIGVYMYSLFSAYNQAYSVISGAQGDKFDDTKSILDIESSFDETGEVMVCKDWILKEADYITRNIIALDMVMEDNGITLDEVTYEAAMSQAKKDWYLGSYYEEYLAYGYSATPYEDMLEPYGVSFDSFFESTYLASLKQNAIFDHFYDKGGEKEVPEAEMKDYFEDNYTSYAYFTVNLYETSTDNTTGETVNKALAEDKIADIKADLNLYQNMIKNGTSYEDVTKVYTADMKLEYNPSISNIENLENTSLGTEIAEAIKGMKDGATKIIYVGQENSTVAYFVYKKAITAETKKYVADDANYDSLLREMRSEEFLDYIDGLTYEAECEVNTKAISEFKPELFEADL